MVKFAHRIGKRLLVDETFLDDLADALDGIDVADELSESEDEEGMRTNVVGSKRNLIGRNGESV